ncbi:T9SS type A sorting domain-containing protein [bacterium]|nr:T9SS type A sorting domain-containing protein [bacterium]
MAFKLKNRKIIFHLTFAILVALLTLPQFSHAQLTLIGDGNIAIQVDTTYGFFGIGTADGDRLLYNFNFPWSTGRGSGHFVFRIDDGYYSNAIWPLDCPFQQAADYIVESRIIGNTITTLWEIPLETGFISVRQNLTAGTYDTLGTVKIEYSFFNNDSLPHSTGLYLNCDLLVAGRDNAPVAIGFDYTSVARVFTGERLPYFWQAYQIGPTSTSPQISARGFLRGAGTINPDLFAIAQQSYFYPPCWEIDSSSITGVRYYDSGLLFRWSPQFLSSGKGINYSTNIGLGEVKTSSEDITFISLTPTSLGGCRCILSPNPFEAPCLVANNRWTVIESIQVCISIPEELNTYGDFYHPPGLCHFLTPPNLQPDSIGTSAWLIYIDSTDYTEDTTISIVFEITNKSFPGDTILDTTRVKIPHIPSEPPTATLIQPYGYVSCDGAEGLPLKILIDADESIDMTGLRVRIDDLYFDYMGGDFTFSGDTLILDIPDIFLRHTMKTKFTFFGLMDIYGCSAPDTIQDSFIVDLEGPYVSSVFPNEGDVVTDSLQPISIVIKDDLSGVDETGSSLTINGESYEWGDPGLTWEDSLLVFTPFTPFPDRTWINVRLTEAYDSPDFCSPNPISEPYHWSFRVSYADIEDTMTSTLSFELCEPYPNPFNKIISIEFTLPMDQEIELNIIDIYGQKVNTLYHGRKDKGLKRFVWAGDNFEGKDIPSGLYIIALSCENKNFFKKVLYLK